MTTLPKLLTLGGAADALEENRSLFYLAAMLWKISRSLLRLGSYSSAINNIY